MGKSTAKSTCARRNFQARAGQVEHGRILIQPDQAAAGNNPFGQQPSDAVEWYFPDRLRIDTNGASALRENAAARFLGLHIAGPAKVDLPLYAIQTDLTHGAVLRGARKFIKLARTTAAESTLVNADPEMSHLDPLTAAPDRNKFLKTVVPFLDRTFAAGK